MKRYTLLFLFFALQFGSPDLSAQSIYYIAKVPFTNNYYFWKTDPATCQTCPVMDLPDNIFGYLYYETAILPNGHVILEDFFGGDGYQYNPVTQTSIPYVLYSNLFAFHVHPNGTVYVTAQNTGVATLHTYDPVTQQFTLVGNLPTTILELFYTNGQLYGFGYNQVYQINVTNPSASTVVQNFTFYPAYKTATSTPGGTVYLSSATSLSTYDVATNTVSPVCTTAPPWFGAPPLGSMDSWQAITTMPMGMPDLPCTCLAVNSLPSNNIANPCVPNALNVPFAGTPYLEPGDVVRYILYTDFNNPLGTILFESSTPNFAFVPPLVAGTPYFMCQVIGNALNGSFDPNDPCLRFSITVNVQWREKPTLTSVTFDGPICDNDCGDATITVNGNPPFMYTWQVQQGGNIVSSGSLPLYTQNATSTFQACVPAGINGPVDLVICTVTDAFCTSQ